METPSDLLLTTVSTSRQRRVEGLPKTSPPPQTAPPPPPPESRNPTGIAVKKRRKPPEARIGEHPKLCASRPKCILGALQMLCGKPKGSLGKFGSPQTPFANPQHAQAHFRTPQMRLTVTKSPPKPCGQVPKYVRESPRLFKPHVMHLSIWRPGRGITEAEE